MRWNNSYHLLQGDTKSITFFNGIRQKVYDSFLQHDILTRFFDAKEIALNQVIETYRDSYSLQDILEGLYGLIQDGIVIPHPFLKVAITDQEQHPLLNEISQLELRNVQIDTENPDLTVFIVSDLLFLRKESLSKLTSRQFTILWISRNRVKLFPLFETSDTASFFYFLNRLKRAYYPQLLAQERQAFSLFEPKSFIQLIVDYLPDFIHSGEAQNTLVIFDKEKLQIERILLHDTLIKASHNTNGDIIDEYGEPADVVSVYRQLSFHLDKTIGLVDKIRSTVTPFGGWVSSGGEIYRSNKVSNEVYFSKGRASGNGFTKDESEAKAFCETLERFSQVFRENEDDYLIDTYQNLGSKSIHPNEILLFSPTQYFKETAINHTGHQLLPFDELAPISWSSVENSFSNTTMWIPTSLLYMGGPAEDVFSEQFFKWITNGTAAGATLEMARLHALYELIERDAYAIWWYNDLNVRGVDTLCIGHLPIVDLALKEHEKSGKKLYVFDITQDIRIPTVAVISDYLEDTFILGCGSNISFEKACVKAFNELNQLYLHHVKKNTKLSPNQIHAAGKTLSNHKPEKPTWNLSDKSVTIKDELKAVETEIRNRGLTIYYKDLSRRDVLLPVVKAIVPGMRDLDTRFGTGRLFSVVQDLHGFTPIEDTLRDFNLFY